MAGSQRRKERETTTLGRNKTAQERGRPKQRNQETKTEAKSEKQILQRARTIKF